MARPRDPAVDERILDAAQALFATRGYHDTTMEAVAERAGVGKPTLYRRWASKAELALALEVRGLAPVEVPDTGDVVGDLKAVVRQLARWLLVVDRGMLADQIATMIADEAFAARASELVLGPESALVVDLYRRGVQRGQLRADQQAEEVVRDLAAAVVVRSLVYHEPMTEEDLDRLVQRWIDGLRARTDLDPAAASAGPAAAPQARSRRA